MAENENRKKYIAVDPSTQETNQIVRLVNSNNQISGRIKAVDAVNPIELDDEDYTLEDIAQKLNEILLALKRGGVTALIACVACMGGGGNAVAAHEGQAKLGTLSAKTYVVTQEVDSVFTDWLNHGGGGGSGVVGSDYNLQIGVGTTADLLKSVAMGVFTSTTNYNLSTPNSSYVNGGYSMDFCGPTLAFRHSTAVGAGAQAISQVAVAIGERAMVHGLHGPSTSRYGISVKHIQVKELSRNGSIVSVVTNELSPFVRYIDRAMYEYPPSENLNTYELIGTSQRTQSDGSILTTREYARTIGGGQIDPRYATQEEMDMYDIIFNPGQPDVNFKDAIYSVAVGYRAMCAGYHTLALGHYARAYRPHSIAIGPSSHIKSEGAIGLGYNNTVDYNSPFSLAIGSRISIPQGFTNAIVIGMPKVDFSKRFKPNYHQSASPWVYTSQPRAMKSNSINIVVNGEGLKDFFLDDVPMTDRMATDISVVGNSRNSSSAFDMKKEIDGMVGIPSNESHIVFFSKDGGVKLYTRRYLQALEDEADYTVEETIGDVSEVEINGKNLDEIIRTVSGSSGNTKFEEYHAIITNNAAIAKGRIETANNIQDLKIALNNFFDAIK